MLEHIELDAVPGFKPLYYKEYLKTEWWKHLRKMALERDKYQCQLCGSAKNIQVHHISYENLGCEEEIDDLVCLCSKCHSAVHTKDMGV